MKPMRYISLIIALLSVLGVSAQQQQSQYALYNYRNDGDFNAWLNIDVDSITYSNIGLDSVEYDNIVTQEVWTPDSCYRIPIEVIDSIGFRAPAPEFKDGIFHITEEHIPYTVVVDSLSVTFDSSIPASMLPAVGQVVISDVYEEPYEDGFAGRVLNIVYEDGTTRIDCSEVGLEDVYDQLICVGKTIAYEDDEDMYSSRRKSPRKIKINEDGTIEVPLGKFSLKLSDGKTASINLSAKPSVDIDYNIVYNVKGIDNKFMIAAKPKMEYGIDYTVKFKKDIIPPIEEFLGFIPVETGIPGLRCKIRFGGFLELEGDVSVEGKLTYEMKATGGYDSSIEENNGFFFNHESGWKDPEVAINMEGKLFLGPMMQVFAYILYDKGGLPYAKFNVKPGVEVSGKIVASTDGLTEYGFSAYDLLKDTKVSFAGKLKAEASAGMFGKEFKLPSYTLSPDWLKQEYYLFPEFTKPELKGLNETSFSSTALFSEVTRDILFQTELPVYVGMAVYDELDNSLAQDVSTRYIKQTSKTYVGHNMENYSAGKYVVRPVVKNVFGTFVASPVTEFTVPEPMSLEMTELTLQKNKSVYVAINGGWGDYSASPSPEGSVFQVCTAEIIFDNEKPFVKITASDNVTGSLPVTVKDLRAGTTETILVTVSGDESPMICPDDNHPHLIDLGLPSGTKWSCCNVGASQPEAYGYYYQWGETTPVQDGENCGWNNSYAPGGVTFTGTSYRDCCTAKDPMYVDGTIYQDADGQWTCNISGNAKYDAATANWGASWRMFTDEELNELYMNCTFETASRNGVSGCEVKSNINNNVIFFPAAGCRYGTDTYRAGSFGSYWLPTLWGGTSCYPNGWYFGSDEDEWQDDMRCCGRTVRPVSTAAPVTLALSESSVTVNQGGTTTVDITSGSGSYTAGSSDEGVATATVEGNKIIISGVSNGPASITVTDTETEQTAIIQVTVTSGTTPDPGNHAWVDLGLPSGTKWATCNVGANSPEEYGDYFAWGETAPKDYYHRSTYFDTDDGGDAFKKYNNNGGLTELLPEDDAATKNWGSPWHMPTLEQIEELLDNCTREWTTQGGVNGTLVTGPNGSTIFLPAAGYRWSGELYDAGSDGYYWSSSLYPSGGYYACYLYFSSGRWSWGDYGRYDYYGRGYGQSVRAVCQ